LTFAASLGRCTGAVVTQWSSRNSGALAGPRLGGQTLPAASSCAALSKWNGVSCSRLSYASWYQDAAPAWFSASSTSRRPEPIIDRSVGSGPGPCVAA